MYAKAEHPVTRPIHLRPSVSADGPSCDSEANHRIANSLQLLSGMIGVDAKDISDPASRSILMKAQTRLAAIAGFHRSLYVQEEGLFDLGHYLDELGDSVRAITPSNIFVSVHNVYIPVPLGHAQAIGILVAELVMNACKHAYAADERGIIAISLRKVGDDVAELTVEDRGSGRPPVEEACAHRSAPRLGHRVIDACVVRLGGRGAWEDALPGTRFRLLFPILAPACI